METSEIQLNPENQAARKKQIIDWITGLVRSNQVHAIDLFNGEYLSDEDKRKYTSALQQAEAANKVLPKAKRKVQVATTQLRTRFQAEQLRIREKIGLRTNPNTVLLNLGDRLSADFSARFADFDPRNNLRAMLTHADMNPFQNSHLCIFRLI